MFSHLRWKVAQFLELHWWKRYLRKQSPQAYLANKKDYWQRVLDQIGHRPRVDAQVLDAGCGLAGIFILLHEQQKVTALDPLLDKYEAELTVFQRTDYPGITFIGDFIEASSLETSGYDTIYCFNAINHVKDWEVALDQLSRWCKPGGKLIVSSDVHRRIYLLPLFRAIPGDALHPQQHAAEAYREALKKRSFRIEREDLLRREWIFDYVCWTAVKE